MRIAIITGGETAERDVSIRSAKNVAQCLDTLSCNTFVFPADRSRFFAEAQNYDLVVPVIHGIGGEDGVLQTELDQLGVPYLFSGPAAHAIAIDKKQTKEFVRHLGIRTAKLLDVPPFFAKPRSGGSSVASKFCDTTEEFTALIQAHPDLSFICEEPLRGREFTVGVAESDGELLALPVIEIIPRGNFFDFENKYDPLQLATEVCPAEISTELALELKRQAVLVHGALGVRHLSRSDFIVLPSGEIYFLEINTIPGMTDTSLLPKMLKAEGLSLEGLLKEWISDFGFPPTRE